MGHLGHPIYVCIYLDIVTWCGLQCYFIDHHFIAYDAWSTHFHIVLHTVYSRNRRTRESPKRIRQLRLVFAV